MMHSPDRLAGGLPPARIQPPDLSMKLPICSVAALVAALLASGCASTVSGEPRAAAASTVRAPQHLLQRPACAVGGADPRTAFFLTISGGGSRAAVFGARVLSELKNVDGNDLTKQINAISSVSGGSMAASLYGISKDTGAGDPWRPQWGDDLIRKRLAANMKMNMASQLINPVFLGGYVFGHKNRTDALFATMDSDVLGLSDTGHALSMADLNPSRPQIIINSTVATKDDSDAFRPRPFGSLFTFTPTDLESIGVDYSSLPLSRAVAASAAFPGLLSPVVLNRYQLGSSEQERGEPKYIHLMDGGNVDNLGLLAVKRALVEDSHRLLVDCDQILVMTVDAFGAQGYHKDNAPSMRSTSGLVMDGNTLLSAFDALLAANRTRLLAEFKSRSFTPPADTEQCRKDDLPSNVCLGGVRVNWDEVNALLKQKLLFVHLSFNSGELPMPPGVDYCSGPYEPGKRNGCDEPPIDSTKHWNEIRALRSRLKQIPTTFGLSGADVSDITAFVRLWFTPKNGCLTHLRGMLAGTERHGPHFYMKATASCDETSSFTEAQLTRRRNHQDIAGDWIRTDGKPIQNRSIQDRATYTPLATVEERDAFWAEVLKYYGKSARDD